MNNLKILGLRTLFEARRKFLSVDPKIHKCRSAIPLFPLNELNFRGLIFQFPFTKFIFIYILTNLLKSKNIREKALLTEGSKTGKVGNLNI